MARDFTTRRRVIVGGVIFLVVADVALAVYSWQLASAPRTAGPEFAKEETYLKTLQGDLARAKKIKDEMPKTQLDCQKFESSLLPASTGYSSVSSELGAIARKSGVRLQDVAFKPTAIPERRLTEVAMASTIEGDYKSVILFLNELQRSANIYEVDSLRLATDTAGAGGASHGPSNIIKVELQLKTYFRMAV
jgi:hypothetical protein